MSKNRDQQYDEFVALLGHGENRVRRFVRSLMIRSAEIDDVMQDVSLECWRKFDSFTPDSKESQHEEFVRWACVIARFKVMSRLRDAARDRLVFDEGLADILAAESESIAATHFDRHAALEGCLGKLPADDRRLLLSVHAPGESVAKIARETGTQSRRLYSRVNSLRWQLLKCVRSNLAAERR